MQFVHYEQMANRYGLDKKQIITYARQAALQRKQVRGQMGVEALAFDAHMEKKGIRLKPGHLPYSKKYKVGMKIRPFADRINYIASSIREKRNVFNDRIFDACLESFDGDYVVVRVHRLYLEDPDAYSAIWRYLGEESVMQAVAVHGHLTNRKIATAARLHRERCISTCAQPNPAQDN